MTPLEKAEAVLAAFRQEVQCAHCGQFISRADAINCQICAERTGDEHTFVCRNICVSTNMVNSQSPAMTPLEKAEAVLIAMRGKLTCQRCHNSISREDIVPLFGTAFCRWCWRHMSTAVRNRWVKRSIDLVYDATGKG